MTRDPLWFKDAIIYALHVKTFHDSNGDGIGDFAGLIEKLDYLDSLGVTCLWLLPFYVSPLRDGGYDVADYNQVDRRYGTLDDFRAFVDAAHQRGLRVITELVVNHTSNEHPWFERARRAPAGSSERDFYVWSDTDQRNLGARVIFRDAEPSNWTWDPVAGAYYWHRFFRHQPDLNFDNPAVRSAIVDVMRFWLDLGVDGLRLDAVAHWYAREGTTCDNLPETHDFLRDLRAILDRDYPARILLAEVNQPPAETRRYFGAGDECHMAFHFPLMPRLFSALARRRPEDIVDVVLETDDLPGDCQWALFLRNHDELTLSAVSEEEREFLLAIYGADARARLNLGIRRRLAPLLENDPSRIVLATALLLSLPGSPVFYYGDEIGLGDDLRLADRDGVRTPMQWSADRDGHVNVASQEREPDSLLRQVRQLIHVRREHRAFGRGGIEFLESGSPHVLAFTRTYADETLLVVANLADTTQDGVFDLAALQGSSVLDILHGHPTLPVDAAPYSLSLAPHAARWFRIVPALAPVFGDLASVR
jgi:maltose alpha-D-glucosyltransferase/alpha-amylase